MRWADAIPKEPAVNAANLWVVSVAPAPALGTVLTLAGAALAAATAPGRLGAAPAVGVVPGRVGVPAAVAVAVIGYRLAVEVVGLSADSPEAGHWSVDCPGPGPGFGGVVVPGYAALSLADCFGRSGCFGCRA